MFYRTLSAWLIAGQFGVLALLLAAAARLYWSGHGRRRGAPLVLTAAVLWGALIARAVFALTIRADNAFQRLLSQPLVQLLLVLFEFALLVIVLIRERAIGVQRNGS